MLIGHRMKCFYAAFLSFFYAFLLAAFSQMIFHSAESDIFFCAEKNKNLLRGGERRLVLWNRGGENGVFFSIW